jgi:hypothetical protein
MAVRDALADIRTKVVSATRPDGSILDEAELRRRYGSPEDHLATRRGYDRSELLRRSFRYRLLILPLALTASRPLSGRLRFHLKQRSLRAKQEIALGRRRRGALDRSARHKGDGAPRGGLNEAIRAHVAWRSACGSLRPFLPMRTYWPLTLRPMLHRPSCRLYARRDGQFSFLCPSRPVSSHPHHLC